MGMPSELWPRKRVKAHFGWIDRFLPGPAENNAACYFNQAEFTDDTSMALCLADAIIECDGEINPDVIGKHILDWALDFDAFNKNVLGPTSKIALNAIRDGKPVSELENNGVTNGAAMRASPLGCLLPATRLAHFVEQVAFASLSARIELALKTVREANCTESASEQIYQLIGAGTSTLESVPAAIAMVELAGTDPNRCAVLCANLGGDTDTIGAMATAICGALHGVQAIDPALKSELDAVNQLDFGRYCEKLLHFREQREGV